MPDTDSGGAALRLAGVRKSFGAAPVLSGVDLDAPPGGFLSIVGKSGCGKSTLLRLVAGLDAPTGGSVMLDGAAPADRRDAVRIMFQEPRLLPWASVLENVEVGLGTALDAPERRDRALQALAAVQLAEKAGEWPARLSGGQRQRVALARALVSRPRLLALDEPLGALDALTRITMQDLILTVKRSLGFTALLVTHDVAEAVALSDRVIVLDGGRVALDVAVDAPHPRPRGSSELARLEGRILDAIFASERPAAAR